VSSFGDKCAIAIMAKSPRENLSSIKTRLIPVIPSSEDRAVLYTAWLRDLITRCRNLSGVRLRVAYTPEGGSSGFSDLGIRLNELLLQRGSDLGKRVCHVFDDLFSSGFSSVVIIGSDIPTLPLSHLVDAFTALVGPGEPKNAVKRVVLGESNDGGYHLIGLNAGSTRRAPPELFLNIRWSTPFVMLDTVAASAVAGLSVIRIESWYDVDNEHDLVRLSRDFSEDASLADSSETERVLSRLLLKISGFPRSNFGE